MSAFALYLFFMLDSFRSVADAFLFLSIVMLCIGLTIFGIGFLVFRSDTTVDDRLRISDANEWCEKWLRVWKWWRSILIPVFCVSLTFLVFLPNTKQAVAIYVIPKVINAAAHNKELMELPQEVVKMAKLYLNKVMVKWSKDIEKDLYKDAVDTSKTIAVDSATSPFDMVKVEQAAKDAKEAYDKAMQALDAAKKVSNSLTK